MPQLPYTSQIDARSGRSNSSVNVSGVTPDAFGAGIGRATEQLGRAIQGVGDDAGRIGAEEVQRKRNEQIANGTANFDPSAMEYNLRSSTDANATDYTDNAVQGYRDYAEDYLNQFEDDRIRQGVRERIYAGLDNFARRSREWEYSTREKNQTLEANTALSGLQNRITADPTQYDMNLQAGYDVIEHSQLPAGLKAGAKQNWKEDSAQRRFEGMLTRAKTLTDIDAISADLIGATGSDWTTQFNPNKYKETFDAIGTRRKAIEAQLNAQAGAAIQTLKDRDEKMALIPGQELQNAQEIVKQAPDMQKNYDMARINRNQSFVRNDYKLPVNELKARKNALNGNPGVAYPGLPAELGGYVNGAAERWGVSVGYLGGNTQMEYGQYLKAKPVDIDAKFKPRMGDQSLDTRNFNSGALNAVALAGEQIGQPLTLIRPGKNEPVAVGGKQAVSVSTLGMDAGQRARVVGSLVDAGFTGVAEYNDHVTVSMLEAVPKDFGEKGGKAWGGWTELSPETVAVLKEKGFAAGASSDIIKRSMKERQSQKIDYTKGTGILDETGKPTSTAKGLNQFTKGTWLEVVKDPTFAQQMNIKPGLSDKELLELRGNPEMSINATAYYASKNKKTLEAQLGRPVNDAEMHLAHLLGAGGAMAAIVANNNEPGQSAAKLLPEAAKTNKPLFYDKGREVTVGELYQNVSTNFSLEPTRVAFDDSQWYDKAIKQKESELKDDMMQHAATAGTHVLTPLDQDGGYAARGREFLAVSDYNSIPPTEATGPFTKAEADFFKSKIDSGDTESTLSMMAGIATMPQVAARAAMKQIGQKDATFGWAGQLYVEGNTQAATAIIRGRKKMVENPDILKQAGIVDSDVATRFSKYTGAALLDTPQLRQTVQDAALAYYVNNYVGQKGKISSFDSSEFDDSINAVLGGTKDMPAIDKVNGSPVYMPRGVTADDMERALDRMKPVDWSAMSADGSLPHYGDGSAADLDSMDDATLHYVGDGKYTIMLSDGTYLQSGSPGKPFVLVPDAKRINTVAKGGTYALR